MIINGRFNVLHELGEGGFGKVFLVDDHETKELCALKLIKPELSEIFGLQDKFRDEATTWMAFGKHPNIVGVRSVDSFNGFLSIALEYVAPGENGVNCLDKYLENRRVTTRKALTWAIQLCDALTYANKRGMIAHRDLKPSNIMISHDDSIKLTDFGLSVSAKLF